MALKGILSKESVAVIENVNFVRYSYRVSMDISIYESEKKAQKISSFSLEIEGGEAGMKVIDFVSAPPEKEHDVRDSYIIQNASEGWEDKEGKVISWNGMKWSVLDNITDIFAEQKRKHYLLTSGEWIENQVKISQEDFQKWFGIEAISGDSNLIKQCYLYVKQMSAFSHTEDA